MRYLIVSDIHANLIAFEAVIQHAGQFDTIWCLGDVVGYGPWPNECVSRLRSFKNACVAGNHDWAAIGRLNLDDFNADAQVATWWTQEELNADSKSYLEGLPQQHVEADYTLVHGSPREPIWEYILFPSMATPQFAYFDTRVCFVGHTHAPVIFTHIEGTGGTGGCEAAALPVDEAIALGNERQIINPGVLDSRETETPAPPMRSWTAISANYSISVSNTRLRTCRGRCRRRVCHPG